MLHKRRRKDKCPIGQCHASTYNLPSLTFINNLLHSKSTYFYEWWEEKNSIKYSSYLVPSVCILALLVGLYVSVNPICGTINYNKAYAINDSGIIDGGGSGSSSPTNATDSSLSLTINGNPNEVTPAHVNEVAYRSNTFTVNATKYRNYMVTLSAMNGSGSELHGRNNPYATISGVGENVAPNDFASNTWGYNFTANNTDTSNTSSANLAYSTVPEYSTPKNLFGYTMQEAQATHTHKITFAAKIGSDSPTDHYESNLVLSVVGEPGDFILDLTELEYMQDMTPTRCARTTVGTSKQLKDTRDNKSYWVAKLADGNCWMTQNLDYDIPSTLKAADTDVAVDTPIEVDKFDNTTGVGEWSDNNNGVNQYDPGIMYKTNPTSTASCTDSDVTTLTHSSCKAAGWVTPSENETYDEHYTIGNYYSWDAATAGSVNHTDDKTNIRASDSICPRGWQLPTAGSDSINSNGSFAYLLSQYGFATSDSTGNVGTSPNSMVDAPLYLMRCGSVLGSYLSYAGRLGSYWSSVMYSNPIIYSVFFFEGTEMYPSNGAPRSYGLPIRCVAK